MWIAKKKKQKNTIIIVSAILLTAAVAFPIVSLSKTAYANYLHTVKENTFVKKSVLKKIGLANLKAIGNDGRESTLDIYENSRYVYTTSINNLNEYMQYVSYVFDEIQNSDDIDYYGRKLSNAEFKENYIKHSDILDEYGSFYGAKYNDSSLSPIINSYEFYIVKNLDFHSNTKKVNCSQVLIEQSYSDIAKIPMMTLTIDTDYDNYSNYLFDEYFQEKEITINEGNFDKYFAINNREPNEMFFIQTVNNTIFYNADLLVKLNLNGYGELSFTINGSSSNVYSGTESKINKWYTAIDDNNRTIQKVLFNVEGCTYEPRVGEYVIPYEIVGISGTMLVASPK